MDTPLPTPSPSRRAELADGLTLHWQRLDFRLRATGLQLQRGVRNLWHDRWHGPFPRVATAQRVDEPGHRMAFVRATHVSRLWTHGDATEWRLTAGKVHNLRLAARALDGLLLPAHTVFSFWGAVGRPSMWRGFVAGRELREGCLITSTGGGLCQLSNALYATALDAGAEILERHAHSRAVPGSEAARGRDATVFWNYLDLRCRLPEACEIEARLDGGHLIVRLRALSPARRPMQAKVTSTFPTPKAAAHDCAGCSNTACPDRFDATPEHGVLRAAVPRGWPEHLAFVRERVQACQHVVMAEDVSGWRVQASRILAWLARHDPAARRRAALAVHDARARAWAATLGPQDTELLVPVDWLAALRCDGVLQGRRYRVLMTRPPLAWIAQELDHALTRHPMTSLDEYRASRARVAAELGALADARRLVTSRVTLAERLAVHWPGKVTTLDWHPASAPAARPAPGRRILLPASPLARSGAFELQAACKALGLGVDVLGTAREASFKVDDERVRIADPNDPWQGIAAVAWPSWVSVSPRLLLEALARGLPVVATPACGLPADTPNLHLVPAGDAEALIRVLSSLVCSGTPRRENSSHR